MVRVMADFSWNGTPDDLLARHKLIYQDVPLRHRPGLDLRLRTQTQRCWAGGYKALGATRHDIVIAYWHIVHDCVPYRELGADWAARWFSPEHRARRLTAQLEALGFEVTLEPADPQGS
jgi:hypothetical protein